MSNYPPGVTGNEYEIAGADEVELTVSACCDNKTCAEYSKDVDDQKVTAEVYKGVVYYSWDCPVCEVTAEFERDQSEWEDRDYSFYESSL